jgi:hypothetical protein
MTSFTGQFLLHFQMHTMRLMKFSNVFVVYIDILLKNNIREYHQRGYICKLTLKRAYIPAVHSLRCVRYKSPQLILDSEGGFLATVTLTCLLHSSVERHQRKHVCAPSYQLQESSTPYFTRIISSYLLQISFSSGMLPVDLALLLG